MQGGKGSSKTGPFTPTPNFWPATSSSSREGQPWGGGGGYAIQSPLLRPTFSRPPSWGEVGEGSLRPWAISPASARGRITSHLPASLSQPTSPSPFLGGFPRRSRKSTSPDGWVANGFPTRGRAFLVARCIVGSRPSPPPSPPPPPEGRAQERRGRYRWRRRHPSRSRPPEGSWRHRCRLRDPPRPFARPPTPFTMQPASAKWYDRRDYVFIEFCVEDSKDVNVNFEKSKLTFSCLGGSDNFKHLNEIDLFQIIDPNDSKHKRTDRSILCCLRKGESGQSWPRLTKERAKLNWLSVDFNNWKDWEDDSDEDMSNFDRFSEMMNNMGGDEDVDLPEVDGADDGKM
ncbi:prostaglandin E synthase 3 isoform X2 [Sarcophilus harrisii]|uniref:Prostaglandin E synthase 3 n=1 Tax=Sarcophilus harrisii TaxID=9305 RepID=A0A7N4P8G2_SARHA|nr:prostaglandin E synthase 3 isoform X2 [Sarcophilus harrisii]